MAQITLNSTGVASSGALVLQTNGTTTAVTINASQGVEFNAGTALLPSITTTGDTNTGIFFPAADTIAFAEGGAEAMRLNNSGNLGINTSSPDAGAKLTVAGAILTTGAFSATTGSTGGIDYSNPEGLRFFSMGVSGATKGAYTFIAKGADNSSAYPMSLDPTGQFYLGTGGENTPSSTRTGTAWGFGSGVNNYWINAVNSTATANHWSYVNGNGEVGKITTSGSATTYSTSSDYRLKEAIAPMTGALEKVALLKPCTYKWKVDGSDGQGFIAHELAEVCPDAVVGEKDAVKEQEYEVTPAIKDEEGITVTEAVMGTRTVPVCQGVDTSFLVATLTAAIQEQQALITQLQADVASLKASA